MTYYENERAFPRITKPFAKRRMIRSVSAEPTHKGCKVVPCATCKVLKAIEGDDFNNALHNVYTFKRKYLDFSREEDVTTTYTLAKQYWLDVCMEIEAFNVASRNELK